MVRMDAIKMIYLMLQILIALLLQQRPSVGASAIEGSLVEVDQMLSKLDQFYEQSIQKVFYDTKENAEATQDYQLIEFAAEMADCIAVLHAAERRALLNAKEIITRYFIDRTEILNEVILENKHAIDLILNRLTQAAIEDSLWATEDRRRKVYLLWALHHDADIVQTTMEFLKIIAIAKAKEKLAAKNVDLSLRKYNLEASAFLTARQRATVMQAVDNLIETAEKIIESPLMQQGESPDEEDLVRHYIRSDLLNDIQSARDSTVGHVQILSQDQIDRVDLSMIEKDMTDNN